MSSISPASRRQRGHEVGLIVDSTTGGERAEIRSAPLEPRLALGITRIGMHRQPHWSDALIACRIAAVLRRLEPDVCMAMAPRAASMRACRRCCLSFRRRGVR